MYELKESLERWSRITRPASELRLVVRFTHHELINKLVRLASYADQVQFLGRFVRLWREGRTEEFVALIPWLDRKHTQSFLAWVGNPLAVDQSAKGSLVTCRCRVVRTEIPADIQAELDAEAAFYGILFWCAGRTTDIPVLC